MPKKKPFTPFRIIFPVIFGALLFTGVIWKSFNFIIALSAVSLIAGPFYCGWICPFGFIQEMLGRLGRVLKLPHLKVTASWDRFLRFTRLLLLALSFVGLAFVFVIDSAYVTFMGIVSGNLGGIELVTGLLLGFFLLISLFLDRPFCRYLCIEGAQHGVLSMGRLFSIRRDHRTCTSCKACDKACPTQITVSKVDHIRDFQCINCFKCIEACPVDKTLNYGWAFSNYIKRRKNAKKD